VDFMRRWGAEVDTDLILILTHEIPKGLDTDILHISGFDKRNRPKVLAQEYKLES